MSGNLKDILSGSNKDMGNQQLMDYLSSRLSKEQQHEVEKNMAADDFVNDAVEGLQQINSTKKMQEFADDLNRELQKQIEKNKKRKNKRRWKDAPNTYIIILLLLTLMLICFFVIKKMQG